MSTLAVEPTGSSLWHHEHSELADSWVDLEERQETSVWLSSHPGARLVSLVAPPTEELARLWVRAVARRREAVWGTLPEDIADWLDGGGYPSQEDIRFLCRVARAGSGTLFRRRAALRSLAIIAEDIPEWRSDVLACLISVVRDVEDGIRAAAIEAIWQIGDPVAIEPLRAARDLEEVRDVSKLAEHALCILEAGHSSPALSADP